MSKGGWLEPQVPTADVYACGLGLEIPNDLTLETIAILRRSRTVFALPLANLSGFVAADQIVDLSRHYNAKIPRHLSYNLMAAEILGAATLANPCTFATYGHPIVGTQVTQILRAECPRRGLSLHVSNAPSSLEAVSAIMGLDPFIGLQICDATVFLLNPERWSTKSWLFLMQAPYIGSVTATHQQSDSRYNPDSLSSLHNALADRYSNNHRVFFVRSKVLGYGESVIEANIDTLSEKMPASAATLVIPPI